MAQAWRAHPGLCSVPMPSFLLLQKRALLGADSELRPGATGLSLQRGCCGRGSLPSQRWRGLGSQGIYLPDSRQHGHRRPCSHAQRRGQKPFAPATSQGPPPAESVPCSCPFRALAAWGKVFGGGRGVRTARPLQQAEICAVPQPWRGPKRSSGREDGWRHIGPRHARHSCCPTPPVGPPPPSPS